MFGRKCLSTNIVVTFRRYGVGRFRFFVVALLIAVFVIEIVEDFYLHLHAFFVDFTNSRFVAFRRIARGIVIVIVAQTVQRIVFEQLLRFDFDIVYDNQFVRD